VSGLKQLGIVLIVGSLAVAASAQRRWERPERHDAPRPAPQQRPSPPPQKESRQAPEQSQPQPAQPKALFPGRGMQNPGSQQSVQPRRGDWLREHGGQPPEEQEKSLQNDPAFKALAPKDQDRLRQRLNWFNSLPPERRERVMRRHEIIESMTPEQRAHARDLFQRFRSLPESRRKVMDFYFRNLHNMPPEEQQRVMNSSSFRDQFSDEEQNIMRGMTELNLGPGRGGEGGPPDD
jgi:Protein of unknown function (DUF3106)